MSNPIGGRPSTPEAPPPRHFDLVGAIAGVVTLALVAIVCSPLIWLMLHTLRWAFR